jgi:hypothetical protein
MNLNTETHYQYPQIAIEHRQRKVDRAIRLGLITLLLCGALGLLIIGYQTSLVLQSGNAVNVGGRQRMLSQRIAKQVLLLRDARRNAVARGETVSADTEFSVDHEPAAVKHARALLQASTTRFENEMQSLLATVEPHYQPGQTFDAIHPSSMETVARHEELRMAATGALQANSLASTEAAVPRVLRAEESFLASMERSVAEIEASGRQRLGVQAALSGLVVLLQAGIALAIWWFGIRPTSGRLREAVAGISQRMNRAEDETANLQDYLQGFSERLRSRLADGEAQVAPDAIRDPMQATMSLMRLQDKLLQLRVDANEFRSFVELGLHQAALDPVPMRWNEVVKASVDRWREEALARSVVIREHYDPHACTELFGDGQKLKHVLSSAILRSLNALELGEISIQTQRTQSTPKYDWVRWELTAHGSFDPQQAEAWIYQYCQSSKPRTQPGETGAAVQQPVCGRVVRMLGADIEVEALGEDGWRISFDVKLPVRGKALLDSLEEPANA